MTIQQMEYIVAVDQYRHFVRAAEACGVSQSTLSTLVRKLEEELDTVIFNRDVHPVRPTQAGEKIISQARIILYNTEQLRELAVNERISASGDVKIAVLPTLAGYIVPKFFKKMKCVNPKLRLHIHEMQTSEILERLSRAEIDVAIMATPLEQSNLLEIPLYYEKFAAYVSPQDPLYSVERIDVGKIPADRLWVLKEGHCLRGQVMSLCDRSEYDSVYEAGSIDTLVNIVDENGGCAVIPELHIDLLRKEQRDNIRIFASPEPVREVSMVVRTDYVRERVLNDVSKVVQSIIPKRMLDPRLKKFAIRL